MTLCSWQDADKRICGVNFCQKKKVLEKKTQTVQFDMSDKGGSTKQV